MAAKEKSEKMEENKSEVPEETEGASVEGTTGGLNTTGGTVSDWAGGLKTLLASSTTPPVYANIYAIVKLLARRFCIRLFRPFLRPRLFDSFLTRLICSLMQTEQGRLSNDNYEAARLI